MLNLQKIEKKLKKIYVFEVLRLLEAKFQSFSFLYLNPILNGSSRWKNCFDPRCSSKDMTWVEGNFQELFSHWSMDLSQIGLQYHWGLGVSFPKWYDTCIFVEKWPHNRPKSEELRFWSKFWQNFRGLFEALKTLFWCNKRYRWMPPYGYSRFLTPKTNLENHRFHLP